MAVSQTVSCRVCPGFSYSVELLQLLSARRVVDNQQAALLLDALAQILLVLLADLVVQAIELLLVEEPEHVNERRATREREGNPAEELLLGLRVDRALGHVDALAGLDVEHVGLAGGFRPDCVSDVILAGDLVLVFAHCDAKLEGCRHTTFVFLAKVLPELVQFGRLGDGAAEKLVLNDINARPHVQYLHLFIGKRDKCVFAGHASVQGLVDFLETPPMGHLFPG